ncbi:MAG: hypothetical protein JWM78_2115 [Verrucomicrobiaceae bacterium]|nr:hypothetical protein [Verrucomicrobiaceae bacterium]
MATSLQLERIAALVEKLDPVANKQRGMRIEADEWNVLIDVLRGILQIDRTQEDSAQTGFEQRFAAIDHTHIGQVDITWLDADLQARLGGAQGSGSVFTRTALGEATQKITSLGTEVARLSTLAETQQQFIDRAAVDAVDRSKTLTQFDARFAGVENLRTLVGSVSNDVNGLRGNVDTVLRLRTSLSDAAGNPINVAQLQTQVGDLETLRENLKGVDGNLIRLRDIEVKLNEVSDAAGAGNGAGLDQRIATATEQLQQQLNTRADQRDATLQQALTDGINASEGRLRNDLNTTVDTRAQALEQNFNARIGDSETRTNAGIEARIASSAESVTKAANENSAAQLDQRLAGVPDQVRATTNDLISALRADLSNQISANVSAALDTRFNGLQTQIDTRFGTLEGRVNDFETRIPGLVANGVDTLRADLATNLREQINAGVEGIRGDLQNTISEQIKGELATAQIDLDTRIGASVDARFAGLDDIVNKSVERATRGLSDQINSEVKTQIDALKLNDQIRSANTDLATQLRSEQTLALANQDAKNSAAINSSVTLLRGEIGATRSDLTNAINTRNVIDVTRPVSPVLRPNG